MEYNNDILKPMGLIVVVFIVKVIIDYSGGKDARNLIKFT